MFSVFPTPFTSLAPIPPTPMQAMLSLSLGAVKPRPSTWRGTMVKATPAPTSPTNLRLEMRLRAMRRSPLIGRHGLGRARASRAKEHCEQEQYHRREPGGQHPEAGPAVERETGSAAKHPHRIDAQGSFVYPGFIDAHAHFVDYGASLQRVDLTGTKSWSEV